MKRISIQIESKQSRNERKFHIKVCRDFFDRKIGFDFTDVVLSSALEIHCSMLVKKWTKTF